MRFHQTGFYKLIEHPCFFAIFFISLLLIDGFTFITVYSSTPFWIRSGTRLEYVGETSFINFYFFNLSKTPEPLLKVPEVRIFGGNSSMVRLFFENKIETRLSILVEELNGSTALFKVRLEIGSYSSTRDLLVNLLTREVWSLDGFPLGQTTIWIQPCKTSDRIPFVGQGNSTVFAKTSEIFYMDTAQGIQGVFILGSADHEEEYVGLYLNTTLTPLEVQTVKHFHPRIIFYDSDTFIMVEGEMGEDAILSAFDIVDLDTYFKLVSTNIDLGPQNLFIALLRLLPYIILVAIILITTFYFVFVRKRRSRKP